MKEGRVVYLDVIFAAECMMNFFVLVLYSKISGKKYRRSLVLLAVLIASLCGVLGIVFAGGQSWWNRNCSLILSGSIAFLEIAILQAPHGKGKQIVLEMPAMFGSAFLLAGGLSLFFPGEGKISPPGSWYWEAPACSMGMLGIYAALCVILTGGGLSVVRIRKKGIQQENLKTVWITLFGNTYTVTAITDTGNNLYDKSSGMPVHIVEEDRILNEKQKEQLLEKAPEKITFVPYSSLGTSHGLLMVIQAEQMVILDNGRKVELKNPRLGLTNQKLSSSGRWQMLLHPDCGEGLGTAVSAN